MFRFHWGESRWTSQVTEVRKQVFMIEQKVAQEEEFDEYDAISVHYAAVKNDDVVGTARWRNTDNGVKLERFAVLQAHRNDGIGDQLLERILEEVIPLSQEVYLHAQVTALAFYERRNFKKIGPQFDECGILHYKMILSI